MRLLGRAILEPEKKDVGMGLLVYSLYMSCLHTAIPTPSFCSFWHCHPYIPLHLKKMFSILVCILFLLKGNIKNYIVLATGASFRVQQTNQ